MIGAVVFLTVTSEGAVLAFLLSINHKIMIIIPTHIKTIDSHKPKVKGGKSVRIPKIAMIAPTTINITFLIIFLSS